MKITIETDEILAKCLEEIREATGRASASDVVRDALELYDLVVHSLRGGHRMSLGPRGEPTEILLPQLERARRYGR